ncbi:MAG: hypothetical protein EPN26_01505, partial [Rhodospirillales bacterium]
MGIITRLFHRSEGLADNKYNIFFMDMGENIHIHYRDLRIELGVDEFMEFANLCEVYLPQIKAEIEKGYRDGVQPNTNDTTTWKQFYNKKPLANTIAYNPNRISLEENVDGYHIHIRNYKILLDKLSFHNFARAAQDVLDKRERPVGLAETLDLIGINELEHSIDKIGREGDEETAEVTVEKSYYKKTSDMFLALGYVAAGTEAGAGIFKKDGIRISLRTGKVLKTAALPVADSPLVPLTDFIARNASRFSPAEFNLLKLQILDVFEHTRKNKLESVVELDFQRLIYDTVRKKVIFPSKERATPSDVTLEYNKLMIFFREHGLSMVKPAKIPYSEDEQQRLTTAFYNHIRRQVTPHLCVDKIYLLNASEEKRAGRYEVPFVHFDWAKLGSDFDLLIEIDERHDLPPDWSYKFFWKDCTSDYYLLGDVNFPVPSPHLDGHPGVTFYNHLIEAYLFFPSKGNKQVKDEYLKKFAARRIYEKKKPQDETSTLLQSFLTERYAIAVDEVEKLGAPSFNEVFSVKTPNGPLAAKIMKKDDFTRAVAGQSGRHIEYEAALLGALSGQDMPVLIPLAGKDGKLVQPFDNRFCLLLPYMESEAEPEAEGNLRAAARTLAALHAKDTGSSVPTDLYRFNEAVDFWIDQFSTLHPKFGRDEERRKLLAALLPEMVAAKQKILETKGLVWR